MQSVKDYISDSENEPLLGLQSSLMTILVSLSPTLMLIKMFCHVVFPTKPQAPIPTLISTLIMHGARAAGKQLRSSRCQCLWHSLRSCTDPSVDRNAQEQRRGVPQSSVAENPANYLPLPSEQEQRV